MYIVLLNYIDVTEDVIDIQTISKEMSIGNTNISATQSTIILNNIEGKYDDDKTDSLFYASGWYNRRITIYDTEIKVVVFNGRIKGYEADEKQAKIIATNYFKDMLDTTCEYTASNKTPAEHIYDIMTTVAQLDTSTISYGSYLVAVAEQTSLGIKTDVAVAKENNYDCLHVIQELAKMGCMDIYDNNEVIYMKQWQQYAGVGGYKINETDIIPGTFKQWYSDTNLYNDVLLAYSTGSEIAYYNNYDEISQYVYNITRTLKIPDNTSNSTAISDYRIYYTNQDAAIAAAQLLLDRYSHPLKFCEIELNSKYNYLNINDVIDVYLSGKKEPLAITKIKNKESTVQLSCVYLNKPKIYYTEETTTLSAVVITKGIATGSDAITILFTDVNETTNYYEIYFRPADGDWTGTDSLNGLSPLVVNLTELETVLGNYSYTLAGLRENAEYQIKIIVYDNANNKSAESNTIIVRTSSQFNYEYENKYNCKGNLISGITIDVQNSENGELPINVNSDWILYDSCEYDTNYYSPNSVYETALYTSESGFISFSFIVDAGIDKIKWQYRLYNNGIFTEWSGLYKPSDAYYIQCPDGTKGIQFRFIFYSRDWSDMDVIYLNNYQEA